MTRLFADTRPEAETVLIDLLRQTSPWRKLAMVAQLNASVRVLAISGLRQRYPQADEAEIRRRLADLLLGPELARTVYGPLSAALQSPVDPETPAAKASPDRG